jgi:diaminopimelate decarboxylase
VYGRLRTALTAVLDEHLPGWRDGEPVIAFESGRYLVGDSGRLVTTVTDVKNSRGNTYAVLDAGINHLGGLSGLGRLLPLSAQPLSGSGPAADDAGDREPAMVTLAGPLCTPADILARAVDLPGLRPGDLLAFPNVGAYGLSASLLGFLGHPAPAELVVDGTETVSAGRLTLRRHTVAPLTASRTEDTTAMTETTTGTTPVGTADEPAAPWDPTYSALLKEALPRLAAQGELKPDTSLKAAGLDSLAMVEVLVRVEETYGIAVPDSELMADTFATPASLWRVVSALREQAAGRV